MSWKRPERTLAPCTEKLVAEPPSTAYDAVEAAVPRIYMNLADVPVTVKHRLGLDEDQSYGFVRDFVGVLYEAGCRVFIVHARNAVLKGLSPKENRQVPPLRHDDVLRLKLDFPDTRIILNGGLEAPRECLDWMERLDGIMLGRAAWHHPAILGVLGRHLGPAAGSLDDSVVLDRFLAYAVREHARGVPLHILFRGLLGWRAGLPGARLWRRMLSDPQALAAHGPQVLRLAWDLASSAVPA